MSKEYGVFSDGELIDGPFYTFQEAFDAAKAYPAEEGASVLETCPEHPEQLEWHCEECLAEEE